MIRRRAKGRNSRGGPTDIGPESKRNNYCHGDRPMEERMTCTQTHRGTDTIKQASCCYARKNMANAPSKRWYHPPTLYLLKHSSCFIFHTHILFAFPSYRPFPSAALPSHKQFLLLFRKLALYSYTGWKSTTTTADVYWSIPRAFVEAEYNY